MASKSLWRWVRTLLKTFEITWCMSLGVFRDCFARGLAKDRFGGIWSSQNKYDFSLNFLLFSLVSRAFPRVLTMLNKCSRFISATRAFVKKEKDLIQKVQKGETRHCRCYGVTKCTSRQKAWSTEYQAKELLLLKCHCKHSRDKEIKSW